MKRVKRWRYYCDHCGKSNGHGGHMKNHEASCTKNPARHCGMCKRQDAVAGDVKVLKHRHYRPGDEDLSALREHVDGCPACMLAAIVQSGVQFGPDGEGPGHWVDFDFKAEKAAWWQERKAAIQDWEEQQWDEIQRGLGYE